MEFEKLSTNALIESALKEDNDDKRWNYVVALHKRGDREVFEASKGLCESGNANRICLGADILGQLGVEKLPFRKETTPILLNLTESDLRFAENDWEITALQSVIFALGRMEDKTARKRILEFADHRSEDVRYAVAYGILAIDEDAEINALIKLSKDSDEDVRNWATFGLGSQIDSDTAEIREALLLRLSEGESEIEREIRGEALVGLAIRKDERIVEPLMKILAGDSVGSLDIEAAAEMADERFCKALLKLDGRRDSDETILAEAIEKCCGPKDSAEH